MRTLIKVQNQVYQLTNSPVKTGDCFVDLDSKSVNQCLMSTPNKLHSDVDKSFSVKDCRKIVKLR